MGVFQGGGGHPRPHRKGRGPIVPQFRGALLFLCTPIHPLMHYYQILRGNTHGEGLVLGVNHPPTQRGRVASATQFPFTLCRHPLPQNYHTRHDNTYGRCFRRSVTPLHLHKCVARFISDS